ncbi:MAG: hypothetical protein C0508_01115 [Cyanobacteria bacterium PR.023]|nr:hypothetical protein [Cyanobacteria bacterium PR.023]
MSLNAHRAATIATAILAAAVSLHSAAYCRPGSPSQAARPTQTALTAQPGLPSRSAQSDNKNLPIVVLVAGVPKPIAARRNYDEIFAELQAGGIKVFLPFTQYQEAPEPKSLGFETDFFPQYKKDDNAINAMKRHGIKLLVAAEILYPDGKFGAPSDDPLRKLIAWAGRENIYAVYAYDEPAHRGLPVSQSQALYQRVKSIDSTLPVLMVHAPILADTEKQLSESERTNYLNRVRQHSQWADIVVFDIYPIPKELAKLTGPYAHGRELGYSDLIPQYSRWLKENLPMKKYGVVLQGFSMANHYDEATLKTIYSALPREVTATIRTPSSRELESMVGLAKASGCSVIGWWGQSMLKTDTELKFWQELKRVSREMNR